LLATDHIADGRKTLERARRERHERSLVPERWANLFAAARFMLGPRAVPGRRRPRNVTRSTPAAERDVFLGTMIGYFEPIAGIRQMLRARRDYRETGNHIQAAEVDYVLAYIALWTARRQGDTSLADRYVRAAHELLGGRPHAAHGRPYALDLMVDGIRELHEGRVDTASEQLDAAIAFYESSGRKGSFEHLFCWLNREYAARFKQEVRAWTATLDACRLAMEDGQDSALRCHVGFARVRNAIMRGDLYEAAQVARDTHASWPQDEPSFQRCVAEIHMLAPEIYGGDGVRARARLQSILRNHAHFMPTSNMLGADVLSHCAIFEAAALRRGVRGASRRRIARWARTAELSCAMNRHMAMRAAAYAADYDGEPQQALALLARAELRAAEVDQRIDVAIARHQRGVRLRGAEGHALVESAARLLEEAGAHPLLLAEDPARR
jgi:hypothetical protein